ncbi:hypothetical protein Droror1_Dr00024268 [Drosera rotundifolia]
MKEKGKGHFGPCVGRWAGDLKEGWAKIFGPQFVQEKGKCSCLSCGHMYGISCIKKWLRKQKSSGKCSQCKKKCTLKDVRRMYGSRVVVIDEKSNKRIRFLEAKCDVFEKKIRVEAMWLVIDTIPLALIGVESRGVLQFGSSKELSMEGTRGFLLL